MAYNRRFAKASRKFRPSTIKLLFIAEAPPALKSGRFFYYTGLRDGDTLFLEMMKVLYPADTGFTETDGKRKAEFDAKQVRRHKGEFLERFKRDGFYLIDALEQPIQQDADTTTKKRMIRNALPELRKKVRRLCSNGDIPVILIGGATYSVCAEALREDGLRILNEETINHPARGGQKLFRKKLSKVISRLSIGIADCTSLGPRLAVAAKLQAVHG